MTFEDAYKLAHEIVGVFIDEEAAISQVKGSASIYDDDNPVCTLLGFAYSNMFSEEQQEEVKKIFTNPIREQTLKRVRSKMLAVTSVAGQSFAEQVTTNIIDSIAAIGEHSVAPLSTTTNVSLQLVRGLRRCLRLELRSRLVMPPQVFYSLRVNNPEFSDSLCEIRRTPEIIH